MDRHIAVVGLGPAGGLLAAHLAREGFRVTVVEAWEQHRAAIAGAGLEVRGAEAFGPVRLPVVARLEEVDASDLDVLVLALKIHDALAFLPRLGALRPDLPVVLPQNGLEVERPFIERYPGRRFLRLAVNYAGVLTAPGRIRLSFFNRPNYIGCLCGECAGGHAGPLADWMTRAGRETAVAEDIGMRVWEKTVLNAVLAPISALLNVSMGEALRQEPVARLSTELLRECLAVAAACGHRFTPAFEAFCRDYLSSGDGHRPSMLADLDRGRETEIDYLNGRICEYGRLHGIPVPYNEALTIMIKARQALAPTGPKGLG
jgi:2-dehydropantoate 2-reductase